VRKIIFALGIVALIVLAVIGIGVGIIVAFNGESKNYVDGAIPAIAKHWSQDDLIERATPELLAMARPDQLAALFSQCVRLGTMVEYTGSVGGSSISYLWKTGPRIAASYVARAKFENGSATFRLALLRRHGQWMINGFHVNFEPGERTRQGA
jgi:hypothetical protein